MHRLATEIVGNALLLAAIVAGLPLCTRAGEALRARASSDELTAAVAAALTAYGPLTLGLVLASRRLSEWLGPHRARAWDRDWAHQRMVDLLAIAPFSFGAIAALGASVLQGPGAAAARAVVVATSIAAQCELYVRIRPTRSRLGPWLVASAVWLWFSLAHPRGTLWEAIAGVGAPLLSGAASLIRGHVERARPRR